jgi:hypothetical protein
MSALTKRIDISSLSKDVNSQEPPLALPQPLSKPPQLIKCTMKFSISLFLVALCLGVSALPPPMNHEDFGILNPHNWEKNAETSQ